MLKSWKNSDPNTKTFVKVVVGAIALNVIPIVTLVVMDRVLNKKS